MKREFSFVVVGGIGFLADLAALYLLLALTPLNPFVARIGSIAFALTVTWLCNRYLTFAPSQRGVTVEAARYAAVGTSTSVVNYLVYSAVLAVAPSASPLIALIVASLAAMVLSYLGYLKLVFDR